MPQVGGMDTIWNSDWFVHSESRQIPQETWVCFLGNHDMILIGGILFDALTSEMTVPKDRILLGIDTIKRAGVEEVQLISL